jgi:hypothetical protein
MTARQQRRLEQKLAQKAARRAITAECGMISNPIEPANAPSVATDSKPEPLLNSAAPVSQAKLAANRSNAQFSTGAVTQEGKAKVSQNATKHGLTGNFKVLSSESQSEFDQLLAEFLRSESPLGDDEIQMVHQMTEAFWLSRRCVRLQNDCFTALETGTPEEQRAAHKSLALYLRYQTTQDRTFSRYATELRKRRNERSRAVRGFVSQKHKEAAESRRQASHAARQMLQSAKQEAQEIRNRLAAAKAEALELKNLSKKSTIADQTPEPAFAAA